MWSTTEFYIWVDLFAAVPEKVSFYFTASILFFLNVWMSGDSGQLYTLVTVKPTLLSFHEMSGYSLDNGDVL